MMPASPFLFSSYLHNNQILSPNFKSLHRVDPWLLHRRTDARGRCDLLSWETVWEHDHRQACGWSPPQNCPTTSRGWDKRVGKSLKWTASMGCKSEINKRKSINESCMQKKKKREHKRRREKINKTACLERLTWVNTRFSELRLSRLRTKRMDWKRSWMLARNWSSSIPQVALEYRIRDWTMNLKRYSRAWGDCWQDADGDIRSDVLFPKYE